MLVPSLFASKRTEEVYVYAKSAYTKLVLTKSMPDGDSE